MRILIQVLSLAPRLALLSAAALAAPASAALLNVQLLGRATDPKGGPDPRPPSYQGPGVIGSEGDYWNGLPANVYGRPFKITYPARVLASDGKTRIGVTLKLTGFFGADYWPGSHGAPVTNDLMNSYIVCRAPASATIAGLVPNTAYDLCLFGNNSHAGAGASFSVNDAGARSTQGKDGPVFGEAVDYVQFKAVTADPDGLLKIRITPGSSGLGIFNGFQLRGDLPPPGRQPDNPGRWALKLWLKAGDLTRVGLKPGQQVTDWKDAARGISFRPNPNPPCLDGTPTYDEIRLPGRGTPVPVVRFRGEASLRQVDSFGTEDNPMTAFIVFWPDQGGNARWQESLLTRADALCVYDTGIDLEDVFATNPVRRLYYTVYRQSGVRLGAFAQLPVVLAGHQGEFNPDERFKGGIAEVLVFGKLFSAEDQERDLVEDYLRDKYCGTNLPAQGLGEPDLPWLKAEMASQTVLPRHENRDSLSHVSIFSLADQVHAANTEYAAGEVTLPFAYTTTISKGSKPRSLDFPDEPNPDNSQVFVRIDDELWQFRNHWITGRGGATRYKGPDIDHMVQMEDAVYPPETGMGWFLGGMWYDNSEKKLYAPVHVEQEGPFRDHPVASWPARKVALATSMDKGRTWQYEGDIITPDTYFYTYDAYKFSGSGYSNGLCDFGFYVDTRGGYFYIFPEESWYYKGQSGAFWNVRVARCALSDKMAPGKWKFFYNGTWAEPALSGKSTSIAPSHMWGVLYSKYLGKYVSLLTANEDPAVPPHIDGVCIGVCTDLGKQDWTWALCPEPMFGFMNLINAEGNDVTTCGQSFRHYAYFAGNSFRRTDFTLQSGETKAINWIPRYMFESHPESSDPIQSRQTKFIGFSSPDVRYTGNWALRAEPGSYDGKLTEASAASSSIELQFRGPAIYWRALRSPSSGKADVYLDGTFRRTVDCFSPSSKVCGHFVYAKTGLDLLQTHILKIVVKGEKNPGSGGTAIGHIAFEYGAESHQASAEFSSIMGKNNWYYLQKLRAAERPLQFLESNAVFVKDWRGEGDCRVGNSYQSADPRAASVRRWVAPHGGTVRVECEVSLEHRSNVETSVKMLHNGREMWRTTFSSPASPVAHDLSLKIEQGDALSFMVIQASDSRFVCNKVFCDPVITYIESFPPVWKPNPPGNDNLAFGKYVRPRMLACMDRPFAAVDGDLRTAFTIYADDKLSFGEDWLQFDLEKPFTIDRYVLISKPPDPKWRPDTFTLQRSDDGFCWVNVDSVSHNAKDRTERAVPEFTARFVRLYLPKGKPFSVNEFELYRTGGKELRRN